MATGIKAGTTQAPANLCNTIRAAQHNYLGSLSLAGVTIYDTDHLNPYGRELATQLDRRIKLHYVGCTAMKWRPQLSDSRYTVRLGVDRASRLRLGASAMLNSLRCCLRVARGEQLVVLWPRSLFEAVPF